MHIGRLTPQVIIDGGEEPWQVLGPVIARRLDELPAGEVLEILSCAAHARVDIPNWCYLAGHDLVGLMADGTSACFWIRKR